MNEIEPNREPWHPQTEQERELVREELDAILQTHHFSSSKRYPAFLRYVVTKTLSGDSESLKERTLGVNVFHRPHDYDTNSDTVVRFTAGEVRRRLLLYYSENHRRSNIRISLPAGSYVVEFFPVDQELAETGNGSGPALVLTAEQETNADAPIKTDELEPSLPQTESTRNNLLLPISAVGPIGPQLYQRPRRPWGLVLAAVIVAAIAAVSWWMGSTFHREPAPAQVVHAPTVMDDFWAPVLREHGTALICAGSVVFEPKNYSGTQTAGKDADYTFVSMQSASAIARISDWVARSGGSSLLVASASTPLTELSEHSLILIGGYNNQWTMRLLQPMRYSFSPNWYLGIVDRKQPQVHWKRNTSIPYSSEDDYALVARYKDPTIDGWVVALAGVSRNGTEGAVQFVTNPHYLQLLRDKIGADFANRNVEVVLKVNVIDGKTGAPSVLDVYDW